MAELESMVERALARLDEVLEGVRGLVFRLEGIQTVLDAARRDARGDRRAALEYLVETIQAFPERLETAASMLEDVLREARADEAHGPRLERSDVLEVQGELQDVRTELGHFLNELQRQRIEIPVGRVVDMPGPELLAPVRAGIDSVLRRLFEIDTLLFLAALDGVEPDRQIALVLQSVPPGKQAPTLQSALSVLPEEERQELLDVLCRRDSTEENKPK
jgi:hypothetical protein